MPGLAWRVHPSQLHCNGSMSNVHKLVMHAERSSLRLTVNGRSGHCLIRTFCMVCLTGAVACSDSWTELSAPRAAPDRPPAEALLKNLLLCRPGLISALFTTPAPPLQHRILKCHPHLRTLAPWLILNENALSRGRRLVQEQLEGQQRV